MLYPNLHKYSDGQVISHHVHRALSLSGGYLFISVSTRVVAIIISSRGDHLLILSHPYGCETSFVSTWTVSLPDETMAIAASLALARTSSELAGPGVPNVVVTHPGGFSSSAHSETKAQCEGCSRLNFSENIGFNLRRRTQESFLPGASAWPPRGP